MCTFALAVDKPGIRQTDDDRQNAVEHGGVDFILFGMSSCSCLPSYFTFCLSRVVILLFVGLVLLLLLWR